MSPVRREGRAPRTRLTAIGALDRIEPARCRAAVAGHWAAAEVTARYEQVYRGALRRAA